MNVLQRKARCVNHTPRYEQNKAGYIIYHCSKCGWRGQFGNSNTSAGGQRQSK